MSDLVIAGPRGDSDIEQLAAVEAEAFGESRQGAVQWLSAAQDRATLRLARDGDAVVGGYALLPAGQFFGGRSVPAACVAAVSVHPAARRRGVAGALLRDLIAVAGEQGAALAPLHGATTRLYRRWGWEVGQRAFTQTVQTRALASLSGAGTLVRKPDPAEVERLRRGVLPRWDGPLDRPDWWLALQWELGGAADQKLSYGWSEDGVLTGFMRYEQSRPGGPWMTIDVREIVTSTGEALRGLLGVLGSHDAQAPEVLFRHSSMRAQPDLLYMLPDADKVLAIRGALCWMQRIVDVRHAVQARGWPAHANTAIQLEVSDPVGDGAERLTLQVEGGYADVSPGGAGHIQCGIGALSAWYAGTLRALDAARLGLFRGRADGLAVMDTLIGDRDPWMPDYF